MKKILCLTLIITLQLTACKSRKVALSKTDVSTTTSLINTIKQNSLKIDSEKISTESKTELQERDSTELLITPDSGSIQHIYIKPNEAFTYVGKAKNISWKGGTTNIFTTRKSSEQNSLTKSKKNSIDSLSDKKDLNQNTKAKIIESKANNSWFWVIPTFLIVIFGFVYIMWKHWIF